MPPTRKLGVVNRSVAALLALVWIVGGLTGIGAGIVHQRWPLLVLGLLAAAYGVVWSVVVARGRLLTWPDLVTLRRAR